MKIPYGYCHCGCGKKTELALRDRPTRNWIKGQPKRFLSGHYNNIKNRKWPQYKIDKNGCWVWQLALDADGYASYEVNQKYISGHRYYYLKHKGEIPLGLQLDHLCCNRACVNPDHLECVSQSENIRRGKHTKITINIAKKIRQLYKTGNFYQRQIAEIYNISQSTVTAITSGRYWKDV